MTSHLLLKN